MNEIVFASSAPSDLAAVVAGAPARAGVWSLLQRKQLGTFPVAWSPGGRRVALATEAPVRLITAAYHEHGVSAYTLDGQRVWHRKDLKKVQHVDVFHDDQGRECVAVGVESGPLSVLNASTGKTWTQLRGCTRLSGARGLRLAVARGAATLSAAGQEHRLALESFAVLDIACSEDAVCISEAGASLRCFSASGAPRWAASFGQGAHAVEVAWHPGRREWLAVVWNYETGSQPLLVRFDADGKRLGETPCARSSLAPSGDVALTSELRVLDPVSGTELFSLSAG
ncbi:MAG: hypothetical protein ACOZQL_12655 [Myxococcota bacterium]